MRTLLCLVVLTALIGICAGVPARNVQRDSLGRKRRFVDPNDFFNQKKNTKKITKTKPKSKSTAQASTTEPPVTTAPPVISTTSINIIDKNKMPKYIEEKYVKCKTQKEVESLFGITPAMSQRIELSKKNLPGANTSVSGQNSGSSDSGISAMNCLPRLQPIHYTQPARYYGFVYPPCGMALRCGGCCFVDLLRCVPVKVQNVVQKAHFVTYDGGASERDILVEYHMSCKCQCKLTPQHCNPERQYHDESICQCRCKDAFTDSKLTCVKPFKYDKKSCSCRCDEHRHCPVAKHRWDIEKCKCTCDSGISCPKGQILNKNTCECEALQMSSKSIPCQNSNT